MDGGKKGWEMSGGKTVLEFRLAPQIWLISSLANLQIPNERTTIDEPGGARSKGVRGGACRTISVFLAVLEFQFSVLVSIISGRPGQGHHSRQKNFFSFRQPHFR